MYCGICKYFYDGKPVKSGRICTLTKQLKSYDSYQCDDKQLANYFFCKHTLHFISKNICLNRIENKIFPQCKTCKIGKYFTPLTINNKIIKRHKKRLTRHKPIPKRRRLS